MLNCQRLLIISRCKLATFGNTIIQTKQNRFIGSVHFDADDAVFYGKIEGITDLVTFEGESVTELQQAFKDAIEDYVDI